MVKSDADLYRFVFSYTVPLIHMTECLHAAPGSKLVDCMSQPDSEPSPRDTLDLDTLGTELANLRLAPQPKSAPAPRVFSRGAALTRTGGAATVRWVLENPRVSDTYALTQLDLNFRRDPSAIIQIRGIPNIAVEDVRFYVVWQTPRAEDPFEISGLHWGVGSTAYREILSSNGGEYRGLPFRRVNDLLEAHRVFLAEAETQGAERRFAGRVFGWQ